MNRVVVERVLVPDFNDSAKVHHGNTVADVLNHREIVRNKQVRQAKFILQIHQVPQHSKATDKTVLVPFSSVAYAEIEEAPESEGAVYPPAPKAAPIAKVAPRVAPPPA